MKRSSGKNTLITQVYQAFQDEKPPVVDSGVEISFSCDTERRDLAAFLYGKHWSEVTSETLVGGYLHQLDAILFFLTEDGFHFYYPAFLIIALNVEILEVDDGLLEAAFVPFANYFSDDENGFYQRRLERFSSQQLQLIEDVFKYVRNERRQEMIKELGPVDEVEIHLELDVIEKAIKGAQKAAGE